MTAARARASRPVRTHEARVPSRACGALLAVKLDDQLLVDRAVNVVADWLRDDARRHLAAFGGGNPVRTPAPARRLPRAFDVRVLAAGLFDGDGVARLDLKRGDINLAPVDFDVPVVDELTSMCPWLTSWRA